MSALDPVVRASVLDLLGRLQRELGFAALLITHDIAVVRRLADTVSVMLQSEIVEQGNAREILAAPQHPYTREPIGAEGRLDPPEAQTLIQPVEGGSTLNGGLSNIDRSCRL